MWGTEKSKEIKMVAKWLKTYYTGEACMAAGRGELWL
jgi:hypothetical protein